MSDILNQAGATGGFAVINPSQDHKDVFGNFDKFDFGIVERRSAGSTYVYFRLDLSVLKSLQGVSHINTVDWF